MKLIAPENSGSHACHDGVMYPIKDGTVEVPNEASELFSHGFTLAPEVAEDQPLTKEEDKAKKKTEAEAAKVAAPAA